MTRRDVPLAAALGVLIALSALAWFALHAQKGALLALLAVEIVGGREPAIPTGLARGLSWQDTAIATSLIELTSLFLLFPLLVALAAGLKRVGWLDASLARAQAFAQRNPDVDILALAGLTIMPFLPVGALTSVLIGELLRLPSRWLLPALAASLIAANVGFAWATARVLSFLPHPQLVAGAMAALLLVGAALAWLAHRLHARRRAA